MLLLLKPCLGIKVCCVARARGSASVPLGSQPSAGGPAPVLPGSGLIWLSPGRARSPVRELRARQSCQPSKLARSRWARVNTFSPPTPTRKMIARSSAVDSACGPAASSAHEDVPQAASTYGDRSSACLPYGRWYNAGGQGALCPGGFGVPIAPAIRQGVHQHLD